MAEGRPRSNGAALLALAAAAGATAAVSWVTVNGLKDAAVAAYMAGRPIGVPLLLGALRPLDAGLAVLAAAAVLLLAVMEVRDRAFSRLLATATDREAVVLLTVLVAWFGHSYLNPGVLLGGDTGTHIARFLEVGRGLDAGTLPQWTNYQYAGAPLLWFTGPLTYVVGGTVEWAVRDAVLAAKGLLFALHMAAGWMCFALLRRLGIRTVAAVLAAAGFAGAFAHLHLFLYRGVFPQAFTLVFILMLFHAADGLGREAGARWANVLVFALATAGLILNHQPHAVFAAVYLGVFGAAALATGFWRWRGMPFLVVAGILGAVAGVVAVVPVLAEADWVMIEPEGALLGIRLPTLARLAHLVLWNDTRTNWGTDYWAYLGLGLLLFGAAGVAGLVRGRLRPGSGGAALPACLCLLLCLVLYNPVVRDIQFILLFLAILAGLGLDWLVDTPVLRGRRLLLVAGVAVLDLASTAVQPVARTDKGFLVRAGQELERVAPNERVVQMSVRPDGTLDADMGPDGGPISYAATVQRVAGNHNMAATRLHNILAVTVKRAEAELAADGTLSDGSRAMLALLNVGRIVCDSPAAMGCPARLRDATAADPVLGRFIPLRATPAVWSRHLVALPLPPGLDKPMLWPFDFPPDGDSPRLPAVTAAITGFLAAEGFDPATRTARAIPVRDPLPAGADAAGGGDAPPPVPPPTIADYAVTLGTVRLDLRTEAPGFVQLAHPWLPSTVVTVNGAAVQPLHGTTGLAVLPVAAGRSVIELREGWTPVRVASGVASLLGFAAIAAVTGWLALAGRRAARPSWAGRGAVDAAAKPAPPAP